MNINQNLAELLFTWQKTMWCGVMVLGIEFTFLAAILRKDKVFMLLGANILILSAMAGIDIWFLDPSIYQKMHGPIFLELCNDVFHVLTCCFLAALMWLTKMLVNQPSQASAQAHSLILGAFGGAFIFDAILPGTLFTQESGVFRYP